MHTVYIVCTLYDVDTVYTVHVMYAMGIVSSAHSNSNSNAPPFLRKLIGSKAVCCVSSAYLMGSFKASLSLWKLIETKHVRCGCGICSIYGICSMYVFTT